ncbi:MAG: class F sortase [Candidatus Peribacteraceae bacterium]|jgi:sortase (surface protein transpeptidase)
MKRPPRHRRPEFILTLLTPLLLAMTVLTGLAIAREDAPPPVTLPAAENPTSAPPTLPLHVSVAWEDSRAERLLVPARLTVPRLGINAPIETVGLTEEKVMASPSSPSAVSWYRFGAQPGEPGSAVIAGHLDSATGPAVFWRLKQLRAGDSMFVTDSNGGKKKFLVTGSERVEGTQAPLQRIFGDTGTRRLNLITCGGIWDTELRQYRERLVVYTELAP